MFLNIVFKLVAIPVILGEIVREIKLFQLTFPVTPKKTFIFPSSACSGGFLTLSFDGFSFSDGVFFWYLSLSFMYQIHV